MFGLPTRQRSALSEIPRHDDDSAVTVADIRHSPSHIAQRVLDVIVGITEAEELRREPHTRLFEQGYLDSLGTVELLLQLSEEFDTTLSPTEIDRELWATPALIVAFMERRVAEA